MIEIIIIIIIIFAIYNLYNENYKGDKTKVKNIKLNVITKKNRCDDFKKIKTFISRPIQYDCLSDDKFETEEDKFIDKYVFKSRLFCKNKVRNIGPNVTFVIVPILLLDSDKCTKLFGNVTPLSEPILLLFNSRYCKFGGKTTPSIVSIWLYDKSKTISESGNLIPVIDLILLFCKYKCVIDIGKERGKSVSLFQPNPKRNNLGRDTSKSMDAN